jgi:transcriptional regulator with XRE-family HTH domain
MKRRMVERSLSQATVGLRIGITQASVSRILDGKQVPTEETAKRIETELGVPNDLWPSTVRTPRHHATAVAA